MRPTRSVLSPLSSNMPLLCQAKYAWIGSSVSTVFVTNEPSSLSSPRESMISPTNWNASRLQSNTTDVWSATTWSLSSKPLRNCGSSRS